MLELGPASAELHREVGRDAARRKLDWIVGVRGDAAEMVSAAVLAGYAAEQTRFFQNSTEASEFLSSLAKPGDLILVKGSRGVRMERVVEAIRERHIPVGAGATKAGRH